MLFFQAASRPSRVHGTFRAILDGRVTLCMSAEVLSEIRDVLTRPEHRIRFPALTPQLVDAFLSQYLPGMRWVADVPPAFDVPRDPKDNPSVNLAVAAGAKYLVTWNHRHLGYLMQRDTPEGRDFCRRFPSLRIVDPPTFLGEIEPSSLSDPKTGNP
jgi:putative PIN family toxin of toxin-antitoxin system